MSSSASSFLSNLSDNLKEGAHASKTALAVVLSIATILSLIVLGLIIAQIVRGTGAEGASATDSISISIYVLGALAALAWIVWAVFQDKYAKSPLSEFDRLDKQVSKASRDSADLGLSEVPTGVGASSDASVRSVGDSFNVGDAFGGSSGGLVEAGRNLAGARSGAEVGAQLRSLAQNRQLQQTLQTAVAQNPTASRVVNSAIGAANAL